jgi:hypothetical protein
MHCKIRCIIEPDASDIALGAIFSQYDDEGSLHLIAFQSQKFHPPEINYKVHDKERFDILDSFKVWRRYLVSVLCIVMVCSDYQNLKYFTTTKVQNRR